MTTHEQDDFGTIQYIGCMGMLASLPLGLLLFGAALWTHFSDPALIPWGAGLFTCLGVFEFMAFGLRWLRALVICGCVGALPGLAAWGLRLVLT